MDSWSSFVWVAEDPELWEQILFVVLDDELVTALNRSPTPMTMIVFDDGEEPAVYRLYGN